MQLCKANLSKTSVCVYPAYQDGFCILHHPSPNKPLDIFLNTFNNLRSRWSPDGTMMRGLVFPHNDWKLTSIVEERTNSFAIDDATFFGSLRLDSFGPVLIPINLQGVILNGDLSVLNTVSQTSVTLGNVVVNGSILCSDVTFGHLVGSKVNISGDVKMTPKVTFAHGMSMNGFIGNDADFSGCSFNAGGRFTGIIIGGRLDLSRTSFRQQAFLDGIRARYVNVNNAKFDDKVDMSGTDLGAQVENVLLRENFAKDVLFNNSNLSRCLIVVEKPQDLSNIRMARVNWSTRSPIANAIFGPGFHIFPDMNLDDQIRQMRIYRAHFLADHRTREAGFFYIREMELQRKLEKRYAPYCWINWLYSSTSRYGESVFRPLALMVLLWLSVSVLFFFQGLTGQGSTGNHTSPIFILDPFEGKPIIFDPQYWNTVALNINLMGPHRRKPEDLSLTETQLLLVNIESIITLVLLSFLVVAARRRFKKRDD